MKKKLIYTLIGLVLGTAAFASIAEAQVQGPNFFKRVGNVVSFLNSSWDFGSSTNRIANGYFTNIDATNGTIGTLTVTGVSGLTQGSVIFAGASGALSQNNSKLYWDNTNFRLGIGTSSPAGLLDVLGSSSSTDATTFDSTRGISIINSDTTNNNLSSVVYRTYDTNGAVGSGAKISGIFTNHTAGSVSGELAFLTRNAGTMTEKMRIQGNGFVGLGTSTPQGALHVVNTATDTLRLGYDATNYASFQESSAGNLVIDVTGSNVTFPDSVVMSAGVQTNATIAQANLAVPNGAAVGTVTNSAWLFGGASTVAYRAGIRGGTNSTLGASNSYSSFLIGQNSITEASSGTHGVLSQFVVRPLSVTAGAATVSNTATLYIEDAASATVTGGNYALWIDAGASRFDGNVAIGTTTTSGALNVGGSASTTVLIDSTSGTQGACLKLKDSDGSGYTYVTANNGVLSASTSSCE